MTDKDGNLQVITPAGVVVLHKPSVYQRDASGGRVDVAGSFVLAKKAKVEAGVRRREVKIQLGAYDHSRELVIDPATTTATATATVTPTATASATATVTPTPTSIPTPGGGRISVTPKSLTLSTTGDATVEGEMIVGNHGTGPLNVKIKGPNIRRRSRLRATGLKSIRARRLP